MPRSIVGWFTLCWGAFVVVAAVVGWLLLSLYGQTTAEAVRRGEAVAAHGCDAIAGRTDFLLSGPGPVPDAGEAALAAGLRQAVLVALHGLPGLSGLSGGVWSADRGALAHVGPPAAADDAGGSGGGAGGGAGNAGAGRRGTRSIAGGEPDAVRDAAQAAAEDGVTVLRRIESGAQVLLVAACPLRVSVPRLAGWVMVRVETSGGGAFARAAAGLGILLTVVLGSAAWLGWRLLGWARQLRRLEAALAAGDALPELAATGQRDLDRIVAALNGAGARLAAARARAEALAGEVTRVERMAALGRVAAGIAHEIRNPIAAMRLKAEGAVQPGAASARKDAALRAILDQVARLDRLTGDLLEAGRADPVPAPSPRRRTVLSAFLSARADLFREQADMAGVAVTVEVPDGLEAVVDPDRLARAVDNLLLNAIQAMPAGGRVRLRARRVAAEDEAGAGHGTGADPGAAGAGGPAARAPDRIEISVSDTGPGISPALRPHLFEPFVTGRADGTGLGLAIVRDVAESHGGRVRALHPGDGTTIVVELPAD